jgi:hypothetical protein
MIFLLAQDAQNETLLIFFMYLKAVMDTQTEYLLKTLLLPYIKTGYRRFPLQVDCMNQSFQLGKSYNLTSNLIGWNVYKVVHIKRNRVHVHVVLSCQGKLINKKIANTYAGGNEWIKFGRCYLSSGTIVKKLLFTKQHLSMRIREKNDYDDYMLSI